MQIYFLRDRFHNQKTFCMTRGHCSSYTCVRMPVNKRTASLLVALILLAGGGFFQCYSDATECGHETDTHKEGIKTKHGTSLTKRNIVDDPLFIGFTLRSQTVSERAMEGYDTFDIYIDIAVSRTADREYRMTFILEQNSTAIVEPFGAIFRADYDAQFGSQYGPNSPLTIDLDLEEGENAIRPLVSYIRNDFIIEEEECFKIRIFPTDSQGSFLCNDDDDTNATSFFCNHTICIQDDDEPFVVAFVETVYTVDENVGAVSVCVNLTRPEIDILDETVNVFVIDNSSSVYIPAGAPLATPDPPDFLSRYPMREGSDYAQQTLSVNLIDDTTIDELMRIVCYGQDIYDDFSVELDEYAGLQLGLGRDENPAVPKMVDPAHSQASILILDNDNAVVGFEQTYFNVIESVGVVELCAKITFPSINCPVEFPFDIVLSTADGTAVQTADYEALDVLLTFDTCETRKCANVSVADDGVDEPDEFFTFNLTRTSNLHSRIELDPDSGRVQINGGDVNITLGYNSTLYTTSESRGMVELRIQLFEPAGGAPRPFTIIVNTHNGTASSSDGDYSAVSNEMVQFSVGEMFQTHTITINDDTVCENTTETFFSSISHGTATFVQVTQPQAMIIIDDSQEAECIPIEVGYELSAYTTTENDGEITLCAVVMNHISGSPRPFTLTAATRDGTAESGNDYRRVVNVPLSFAVGDTRACQTVRIFQDDECEADHIEDLFSTVEYSRGVMPIIITRNSTNIVISDTDEPECGPIEVGYNADTNSVTEKSRMIVLTIRVFSHPSTGAPRPFSLAVRTTDGTAIAGGDYANVSDQIVRFTRGDVIQTHTITINDDDACEVDPNEYFYSHIALDSGNPSISVTVPQIKVTIDDNDDLECEPIVVGYDPPVYTVREGNGILNLTIKVFSHPTSGAPRPFTLSFDLEDGTANAGVDYVNMSERTIFMRGDVIQTHAILIEDDDECEMGPNEQFLSNIAVASGILDIRVAVPQANITIDDNDEFECGQITVGYDTDVYTSREGDGRVTLTIKVFSHPTTGAPRPFNVKVNTKNGSASVAGDDYVPLTDEMVHFSRGKTTVTLDITTSSRQNCKPDPNRIFFSVISQESDTQRINVLVPQSTIIITDDSSEDECGVINVGYDQVMYQARKGVPEVALVIKVFSHPSTGAPRPFVLAISTVDGTATANDGDYMAVSGEIVQFDEGDVTQTHTIVINNDFECDNNTNKSFFSLITLEGGIPVINVTVSQTTVFIDEAECGVDCSAPPELENGRISNLSTNTMYNSIASYECTDGYHFHNDNTSRTCLSSGNWSEENILCVEPPVPLIVLVSSDEESVVGAGVLAAIFTSAAVLLILLCLAVGCVVRHRLRKSKRLSSLDSRTTRSNNMQLYASVSKVSVSSRSPVEQLKQELSTKKMLFQKSQLQLTKVVGQGESGLVYRGYVVMNANKVLVAIKTGKALLAVTDKERLLKEVSLMFTFSHPNVMPLIGLSFDEETPLIIMPFMSNGTVLSYVRESRKSLYFLESSDNIQVEVARNTGLGICHQISKGMAYLANFKFVHRDLAARNCMIDENGIIKVADFGLTEDMYNTNYYRQEKRQAGTEERVPLKWMALESIETHVFDESTDVWSFGVTCWEVFTCGGVPYAGVPVTTLLGELRSGHRLDRPSNISCSDDIWSVVTSCWSASPQERPKFATLVNTITDLLDSDTNYIKLLG